MTIQDFLMVSDNTIPMIVNELNIDTDEIVTVADTTKHGDYPFDILDKKISFIGTVDNVFVLEYTTRQKGK